MAEIDTARLTKAEGRRFAWTLAIAFAVIATIAMWRGRDRVSLVLAVVAGLCFVAGAAAPTRLGAVEKAWMSLAHAISRVTTPIFMAVVYFLILTPTGFIRRAFAGRGISPDKAKPTFWIDRPRMERDALRRRMERQF